MLSNADVQCPYCGETIQILLDASAGSQRYIEDCQVCCRPIVVSASVGGEAVRVSVRAENDA